MSSRGDPQRARLVRDGQPVAALDLHGRGSLRPHFGDQCGRHWRGARASVAGPGRRHRAPYAACGIWMPRHAVLELGRAVAGEDEVAVTVDETGDDAAAVERPGARRHPGPRAASPTHRMRPSSITTAALVRSAVGGPTAGSLVTSRPMLSIRVLVMPRATFAKAAPSSAPTSPSLWRAPVTTVDPPTTTVVTSAAPAANQVGRGRRRRCACWLWRSPRGRRAGPAAIEPPSVQPSAA